MPVDFNKVIVDALKNIYKAREFTGYLPAIHTYGPDKRVIMDVPLSVWQVYEELSKILGIPAQTLFIAIATAAATALLEDIHANSGRSGKDNQ